MTDRDTKPENTTDTPPPAVTSALAERKYVDDRDLERLTPISRQRWQQLRYAKAGPPWRKIGRRVIYAWADVQAWINEHPVSGGADS